MEKESGISALNKIIDLRIESMSSIARKFGIHASQVSRIASGNFIKMSGNALKVCIFAQTKLAEREALSKQPEIADRLSLLTSQLSLKNPYAAHALVGILETLIEKENQQVAAK